MFASSVVLTVWIMSWRVRYPGWGLVPSGVRAAGMMFIIIVEGGSEGGALYSLSSALDLRGRIDVLVGRGSFVNPALLELHPWR
jgi:hypothetical protein